MYIEMLCYSNVIFIHFFEVFLQFFLRLHEDDELSASHYLHLVVTAKAKRQISLH